LHSRHLLPKTMSEMREEAAEFVLEVLSHPEIVGLLVAFTELEPSDVGTLERAKRPCVYIDLPKPAGHAGSVLLDHGAGARDAATALVELGCKCVAYIGPCEDAGRVGRERALQVAAVLADRGVMFHRESEPSYNANEAGELTDRLVARHPAIDGIIYGSDIQALGGMTRLKARGIPIPDRIRVIGFDDSDSARTASPGLSSVQQSFEEAGYEAARMLLRHAAGERDALADILLPERLILRGSCLAGADMEVEYFPGVTSLRAYAKPKGQ
jgi:LacI family transcriptional regulator